MGRNPTTTTTKIGNGNQSLQAESLKNVMLNIYSFMPVIIYSLCRKEREKLDIILDSIVIYASHHQLLIRCCMGSDELYIYENEHQDIKFILNSVQKYKMENEPINQNQPNWL
jgi:hypothetical protein